MKKFIDESWLVLIMGIAFAFLLAGTQTSLSARITENQNRALNEAIALVVPGTASSEEFEVKERTVFKCLDEQGQLVGWAIQSSGPGFVDKIGLVVGLSADASRITGLKVLQSIETPGLGSKIKGEWADQYQGLNASSNIDVVKRPVAEGANEVQAITGATWSSRYVTDIVNGVIDEVRPELNQYR